MNKTTGIDIVILWVDCNDPKWIEQYNKFSINNKIEDNRFKDWGTIKYVFRGIEKFLPWVRKIHFITCDQKPNWLVDSHPKINFLTHNEIYAEKEVLPVFNSSSIELNFDKIKDLSDKFIYFNDDMVVLKPTSESRFFLNDLPVDFLVETLPRRGWLYQKIRKPDNWSDMINNSIALINNSFSKRDARNKKKYFFSKNYMLPQVILNYFYQSFSSYVAFEHYHNPQPYLKKTICEVNNNFRAPVTETIKSKFRNSNNISQALYRYYHLASQEFYPFYHNDHSCVNITSLKSAKICEKYINTKRFVCINDSITLEHPEYEQCKDLILTALEKILPNVSSFEKEFYYK
ncbi:stealth family protein [Providencia stuartii]|nr:stealth family protein [Providencia stuartii]